MSESKGYFDRPSGGPGASSTACDDQFTVAEAGPSYAECSQCGGRYVDGSTGAEFIGWHGRCSVCEMQYANSSEIPNSSDEGPLMQAARDGMKRAAEKWARGDMEAGTFKQPRYQDAQGDDWIDEFARTATADEFRGAMRFTIGKYVRRVGRKDSFESELLKIEDYCRRWRAYEEAL